MTTEDENNIRFIVFLIGAICGALGTAFLWWFTRLMI